jgi:hypothetical protein
VLIYQKVPGVLEKKDAGVCALKRRRLLYSQENKDNRKFHGQKA